MVHCRSTIDMMLLFCIILRELLSVALTKTKNTQRLARVIVRLGIFSHRMIRHTCYFPRHNVDCIRSFGISALRPWAPHLRGNVNVCRIIAKYARQQRKHRTSNKAIACCHTRLFARSHIYKVRPEHKTSSKAISTIIDPRLHAAIKREARKVERDCAEK